MELSEIFWKVIVRIGQLIPRIVWTLSLVPNPLATLKIHLSRSFKHVLYQESMAGSVIQATGTVEFKDRLSTLVLQEDCWCPYSG